MLDRVRSVIDREKTKEAGRVFTKGGAIYHFNNIEISVPLEFTDLEFRARFLLGGYESTEEYAFVDRFIKPTSVVLELGGCIGALSCYLNQRLSTRDKHIVLEANPSLIPILRANRDRNSCGFTIINGVISKCTPNRFYIHDLIVGGSLKRETGNEVAVEGFTIDMLERNYNVKFDCLVMDIEGGELHLFRDYPEFFKDFSTILLELHPFANILTTVEAAECEMHLAQLGFRKMDSSRNGDYQVWLTRK